MIDNKPVRRSTLRDMGMSRCICGRNGIVCLFIFVTDLPDGKVYLSPTGGEDDHQAECLHETVLKDIWDMLEEEE